MNAVGLRAPGAHPAPFIHVGRSWGETGRFIFAAILCVFAASATAGAQTAPSNLPFHSVYGRIGAQPGDSGPGSAIPFLTLQRAFTQSGNSGNFANVSGALTAGDCLKADASGNIVDSGTTSCGAGTNTPHTQDFIGGTDYTAGSTTTLTLSSAPSSTDLLVITFDGVGQNANTWSLAGAVVTFNAAIPTGTAVVEAKWSTSGTSSGVGSIGLSGSPLTGAVTISAGAGTSITQVGQNISIGTTAQVTSITDPAYGAKCDGQFISGQNGTGTNLTISSGSPNLFSSAGFFTAADVNKSIWVPGAGAAGVGLSTTIQTVTDATHVVLAANASTAVTAFATTNANPLVYGTDDTAAIQAAMTATPVGGTLFIPGKATGCLIKKQGANNYALLQDHPFNIVGHGHFSNLMTDPSIASTVDDLLIQVGSYDWAGTVWENFSIGASASFLPPTLLMYTRYGKRGMALVDSPAANFVNVIIRNMTIGESSNDYSLYVGNGTSSPSQSVLIQANNIWGGIHLQLVSDSFRILGNRLQGSSTFGGLFEFVAGAGKFVFSGGNNVTWAGGLKIESGFAPEVRNNYFEELYATSESNNAMVDFNGGVGTISFSAFTGNIVNASVSSTSRPVRYANVNGGSFGDNSITTLTSRTGVTSVSTLSCTAPNLWAIGAGSHFSTALASPNPFSC